jgi:glycolate oxidase iron-sulfur subunit
VSGPSRAGGPDVAMTEGVQLRLEEALDRQRDGLSHCVHCGFCLPVCPTYSRLGDEGDSPRGRLHLMTAVVDGRLDPGSPAFQTHIDRCLGCRACEPVCPSGVEYGSLVELARDVAAMARPRGAVPRLLLAVFGSPALRRAFFFFGRALRATGLAGLLARLPRSDGFLGSIRLGFGMLSATASWPGLAQVRGGGPPEPAGSPQRRGRVAVLTGCVQEGLYSRVNRATERALEANGFEVMAVPGQSCCGALHAHGGSLSRARAMARANIAAFAQVELDAVVVNAAGCGATMKEYGSLLAKDGTWSERADQFAAKVRDVSELLAEVGPRQGAMMACSVAVDHPCHLLYGQRIERAPLDVLGAIPGLEMRVISGAAECCGGAGIYGLTHPRLGGAIGEDKVAAIRDAKADAVATPNPGCMMQIGAGLLVEGSHEGVVHPIELLDESYRRAGYYG